MPPTIQYHCSCTSLTGGVPPPPHLPSSSYAFHPLHSLYFCEECDAVRCNRCATLEVSGYYCPNCLFEVPSASVRAEKNRCARNCFLCPICTNTLSVVPSDPPEPAEGSAAASVAISAVGEPPFFLYCNHCRWDSVDAGITFEKPTGLALQLQKTEDSALEIVELDKLKDYFEPALRQAQQQQQHFAAASAARMSPIQAAASLALARDIPSFKYGGSRRPGFPSSSSRRGIPPAMPSPGVGFNDIDDPATEYKPRTTAGGGGPANMHDAEVEWLGKLGSRMDEDTVSTASMVHSGDIASLAQRFHATQYSWAPSHSLRTVDLKPTRVPLRSKKSKRCPKCTHILIKPELKAQSTKWKIKLVAANYLPTVEAFLPSLSIPAIRKSAKEKEAVSPEDAALAQMMLPGRTYPFHLFISNPLYDPITVRLSVQRSFPAPASSSNAPTQDGSTSARRPPYAISLPTTAFLVNPYAEAWEYEDDEDEEMVDEDELSINLGIGSRTPGRASTGGRDGGSSKSKAKTVGVLERRANITKIGGEVVVGKEGRGAVKFNMQISYTYRSDEAEEGKADTSMVTTPSSKAFSLKREPSLSAAGENMKTFSFYTVVDLGNIAPREMVAKVEKQERRESVQTVGVYN